ncbi:FAD:protein FMN transferase [Defluviimonas sp. SAOS-178_SWC]|uniref:FAD:protein FMN transferase n=1 Tax=Defluviimonas sp. SAOS-178_SWC TaxID=3121287 RepID=UPI00322174A7
MHMTRRDVLATGIAACMTARAAEAGPARIAGPAFGSSWHVVLPATADKAAATRAIMAETEAVDAAMSPYRADADLSRFNEERGTDWVPVAGSLCRVLDAALRMRARTGGAFDPTVGPAVGRFGFGPIRGVFGDADGLAVRGAAIRKSHPATTLDLCGIAKGYALDRIAAALAALGHRDALIELGGEVIASGHHPEGRDWLVAIERPGTNPATAQRIVRPGRLALATSGLSANGFASPRLNHIIDPRTARPVAPGLASVSVLAADAETADALATALLVMGPEAGPALAETQDVAALFLAEDGSDIREIMTGAFADHVEI